MPRFSDNEKEIIRQRLLTEGERLFTMFGLKKVSIDEIITAVGIAKGSFYTFYPSKEHLFMDIAVSQQEKMWSEMDAFLQKHSGLLPRELVKQTFMFMIGQISRYPFIKSIDSDTTDYLFRKLPKEVIEAHTKDDSTELLKLEQYGVCFTCDITVVTKILQMFAVNFINLSQEEEKTRTKIINIMLDGVLKEIVGENK
ncbi:TetR/AcrR family transcriptional regulator [Lacrimispora sp.]|uniref:TetR/AcrR family transcriptional regulator n=1 Tax=Lacrimispora sp. TaxID=2719234 RepID=UPI0032E3AED0